jgi:glutamate-ammonia-ligase adenylyltransferase
LISLRDLSSYGEHEKQAASSWPAIQRYLPLVERGPQADPVSNLKLQRHKAWLECALALFHGTASDRDICSYWSNAADRHITEAAKLSGLDRLPVAIFALGKLGAEELNLSSDVDLIIVAEDGLSPPLKEAREFIKILSDADEWGFCHRVDITIRPGGSASAMVPSVSQFENHYGYQGEAWERLALIRLRPISFSSDASFKLERSQIEDEVLKFSRGFSFRRHLDYSVFEELRLLLSRIRSEYSPKSSNEIHLKLHGGCIRDLELFVHALQSIHGGRRRDLIVRRTDDAIESLATAGLLSEEERDDLIRIYWFYRGIENRLQAFEDFQTYRVVENQDLLKIKTEAQRVIEISEAGFPAASSSALPSIDSLVDLGFQREIAIHAIDELQNTKVLSRKSERDEREKNLFLSNFIKVLASSGGDLDLGLGLLVDFVKATRAKATLFSMLNRESTLVKQLALLFGVSPWAGSVLSSRPELLDSFILRQDLDLIEEFKTGKDISLVLDSLSERRLMGELIAILNYLETKDLETCTKNLTSLADQIATDLMIVSAAEIGCEPIGIVALGKWGGNELGVRSDLDFVFFTKETPSPEQQRLARRFLNRMTEAHKGGPLYAIDLRLRPSGHAGPMLVQESALRNHLSTDAEAWERQSWLRARSLDRLPHQLDPGLKATILRRGLSVGDESKLSEIADKLFKPLPSLNASGSTKTLVDLKLVHGGLAPIEFAAQISLLKLGDQLASTIGNNPPLGLETSTRSMVQFLEEHSKSDHDGWAGCGPRLRELHDWFRGLEQAARITGDHAGSALKLESQEFERLAKTVGTSAAALRPKILASLEESSKSLKILLGR